MTFFKEGMATVAEILYDARLAQKAAGGPSTAAGRAAFQKQIVKDFDQIYSDERRLLDGRAVEPAAVQPLLGLVDLPATRHRLRRAAPDRRARPLHEGARAHPARIRRVEHHRAAARGRLPPVAAGEDERLPDAADPVLHAVVRHRVSAGRRRKPAVDHRPGPRRAGVLRAGRAVRDAGRGPVCRPAQRFSSISTNVAARPLALMTLCSVPALPR